MFDYLGTLNRTQWNRLVSFYETEYRMAEDRIKHLTHQILLLGKVTANGQTVKVNNTVVPVYEEAVTFEDGRQTAFPTLVGKLLESASRSGVRVTPSLGEKPEPNQARSIGETPYYLTPQGKPINTGRTLRGRDDAVPSIHVSHLKSMMRDAIKAKGESQEYRLKKVRDLREQLEDERAFIAQQLEQVADEVAASVGAVGAHRGRNLIAIMTNYFNSEVPTAFGTHKAYPSLVADGDELVKPLGAVVSALGPVQKANTEKLEPVKA